MSLFRKQLFRRAAAAALFIFCAVAQARDAVTAKSFIVAAAHPLAVEAGYSVLKAGGSDYPYAWALSRCVDDIVGEPMLDEAQQEGILHGTAERILRGVAATSSSVPHAS